MELEGAKRAFAYLISVGLKIAVFVSDRHRGIAKWIRECQPNTAHYFDIWHVAQSIGKAMLKLSKQKGCERIGDWIKGVRTHLYWCATSTKQGFQAMIAAKWKSLMRHVANKHDEHENSLFKKCAHEEIARRKWIKIGISVFPRVDNSFFIIVIYYSLDFVCLSISHFQLVIIANVVLLVYKVQQPMTS